MIDPFQVQNVGYDHAEMWQDLSICESQIQSISGVFAMAPLPDAMILFSCA
jgi:hypothetical protein